MDQHHDDTSNASAHITNNPHSAAIVTAAKAASMSWARQTKIVVACEECRQRKVKCDGKQPSKPDLEVPCPFTIYLLDCPFDRVDHKPNSSGNVPNCAASHGSLSVLTSGASRMRFMSTSATASARMCVQD